MIWWPWLIVATLIGFAVAVRIARTELDARSERVNRLRALLRETESELLSVRLMLADKVDKAASEEAEHEIDRSNSDWWRRV